MAAKSITRRRASAGVRTTVRVPPEVEAEARELERAGATRGAALQELLRAGADAVARRRADERAAEALRRAFAAPPVVVAGFLSDEEVERTMAEVGEE
jgi:hypothetical protein